MAANSDPYATLGIKPGASDAELRAAYRHQVQLHHPDHNGGSPESARRFEEVQDAYAQIRQLRAGRPATSAPSPDSSVDSRLAQMERELAKARAEQAARVRQAQQAARDRLAARERAQRAAREATSGTERPSDEELGYYKTDDSFGKILADAASELSDLAREAKDHHVGKRVSELIDELGSKLTGER